MDKTHILVMPFLDDTQSFTNGFKVGQIWERFKLGVQPDTDTIQTSMIEQVRLVAQYYKFDMIVDPTDYDEWTFVTFIKKQKIELTIVK